MENDNSHKLEILLIEKTKELEEKNEELLQINKLLQESNEIINDYTDVSKTDVNGIITYASNMFCETIGYSKEELVGQSHSIVKSPNNSKEQYKKLWETIQNDKPYKGIIQNKTKSDKTLWFEVLIKPDYNSFGEKIGYVAYRKNITNEKNLQKIVDTQIEQIREKDSQIYEQLKLSAMAQMIENIAHQWRQPLSLISTVASGLSLKIELDMFDKNEALENLQKLESSSQFLSSTIDDFRDFLKKNQKPEEFNLNNLCNKCLAMVQTTLNKEKIKVINNFKDNNIILIGYKNELIQSIINILNNSKDALVSLDREDKCICIDVKNFTEENKIIITISDNGGGIPKDILPKVFEPYFTTKHQSLGTGIGLFMTREIIQKHFKGKIFLINKEFEYKNNLYTGTECTIEIPITN